MAATEAHRLYIEIAHGGEDKVVVIPLEVDRGTTVAQAIAQSGIQRRFPGLDINRNQTGIFGRHVSPDTVLSDGDRVEIYRPIKADPKEVRRNRANRSQSARG